MKYREVRERYWRDRGILGGKIDMAKEIFTMSDVYMKIYWNGTSKNIIGPKVKQLRTAQGLSQAALAGRLQLLGMECSDLTILRIEQVLGTLNGENVKRESYVRTPEYEAALEAWKKTEQEWDTSSLEGGCI